LVVGYALLVKMETILSRRAKKSSTLAGDESQGKRRQVDSGIAPPVFVGSGSCPQN
jgi:hypothetical protein